MSRTLNFATSEGLLQALLAATAITWSLQLQLIWRAFDTARRPRTVGWFLAGVLVVGMAAMALPVAALAARSMGVADATYFALFWTSIVMSGLFLLMLGAAYLLLILVFIYRRR